MLCPICSWQQHRRRRQLRSGSCNCANRTLLQTSATMGCLWCFTSAKAFHLKVILLDKQELIQEIGAKTTGEDLLNNIFKYLNIVETSYFGLRYQVITGSCINYCSRPAVPILHLYIFHILTSTLQYNMREGKVTTE